MLSTNQAPVIPPREALPAARPHTEPGPEEEASRAAQRARSWGCARLAMASFAMTVPILAVEQLFGLPAPGFRAL